jgi:hypothetical protein
MERLPDVVTVSGIYYDPISFMAHLQFQTEGGGRELRFPVDQILRAEDWFIQLRQQIGEAHFRQKDLHEDEQPG